MIQADYLRLIENGFPNAIATSGTAFSNKHATVLKKHTNRAILAYDSDDAGVNAAIRASYALLQEGVETRVLFLGNNYDPDDFFQEEKDSKAIFKERIRVLTDAIQSQDGPRLPGARRMENRNSIDIEGVHTADSLLEKIKSYWI